jgi:hypothetical protein
MWKKPKPLDPDPGLAAIDAWAEWFRNAHAQRLREFPDKHLLAEERARTDATITAIVQRMRDEYLSWSRRRVS